MKLQAVTTPDAKNGKNRFTVKTDHILFCLNVKNFNSQPPQQGQPRQFPCQRKPFFTLY